MIESGTKTVKKKNKNLGWRPTVMTPEVVKKLEEGFAMGFTDNEACLYAEITKQTLYNYWKEHPEFLDRKEILKDQPKMKAKINITNSINWGDANDSKWYLERKAKDEFSIKTEVESNSKVELKADISAVDKLNELIKQNNPIK